MTCVGLKRCINELSFQRTAGGPLQGKVKVSKLILRIHIVIGVSTQGPSRAMPYQTKSEEQLLLSEELTLSSKRFELVGYYYFFTLFLSIIVLFTSKLTIHSSILYWYSPSYCQLLYNTPISLIFLWLSYYLKLMLIMLSQLLYACYILA